MQVKYHLNIEFLINQYYSNYHECQEIEILTSNISEEFSKAFENLKRHCLGLQKKKYLFYNYNVYQINS